MEKGLVYQRLNIKQLMDCLVPCACCLCRGKVSGQALICDACRNDLPRNGFDIRPPGQAQRTVIDRIFAPYLYRFPVNELIRQLKYDQKIILAHALAPEITRLILKVCTSLPDCVLPIPLHRHRHLQRGYNQAEEIACAAARELSIPVDNRLLYRCRNTPAQFELGPAERRRNIKGAFKLRADPAYEYVALVDDVVTTGATVAEAARLLKKAGVKRVDVWACARTEPSAY